MVTGMDDVNVYLAIGMMMFFIGILAGYLAMSHFYGKRFLAVARECERADSIVPLITEMERES
jgi:hypothetical protein